MKQPKRKTFNYEPDFRKTDFRINPQLYRVGKGEQGVLLVEPYKSEILPYWRFKTPEAARESSAHIYRMFLDYLRQNDFVGADMARKFLQMGYTRARRYAHHRNGQKYDGPVPTDKKGQSGSHGREQLPLDPDPIKAESARIFKEKWDDAKENEAYKKLMADFKDKYES